MVKGFIRLVCLLSLVMGARLLAQTGQDIDLKNRELDSLKNDIKKLEQELESKQQTESSTLETLEKIKNKEFLLDKIVKEIKSEQKSIDRRIGRLGNNIDELTGDIEKIREEYSGYLRWLYKQGEVSKWKYILTAGSVNQAFLRYKYLNYISERYSDKKNELEAKIASLEHESRKLDIRLKQKKELAGEKVKEEKRLEESRTQKEELIADLRKDRESLENEIEEKKKAQIRIRDLITELIEKQMREEEELRAKTQKVNPETLIDYDSFEDFGSLKGRLIWPVSNARVIRNFGEIKNKKLKTVTLNYGIDLKTGKGNKVKAVAGGAVSVIDFIPGYGSIVIITHKNKFRTVYGHLRGITVSEGDTLEAGDILGEVNSSLEGYVMHFEIWKERDYQNPVTWLAGK